MNGLVTLVVTLTALTTTSASEDLSATLARGWEAVTAGRYAEAEAAYTEATAIEPRSEDAWLGLQLARLSREDWPGAAVAGERALALNPQSYWAQSRQAWIAFNRGDMSAARSGYEAALALAPGDGEMTLGLGFTLARLGEEVAARARCEEAARILGDDPRVAACREAAAAVDPYPIAAATLSGSWLGNAKGTVERVAAVSAIASVRWPEVTLWAGGTASDVVGLGATPESLGAAHLGVELRLGAFTGALAGAFLTSDSEDTDGGGVATVRLAVTSGAWSFGVRAGTMLLPSVKARQLDPFVALSVGAVTLTAGPELASVGGERLLSGHLRLDLALSPRLGLWASGYLGERQNPADGDGLAFWTATDRFVGGYRAGVRWAVSRSVALSLTWRHDLVRTSQGNGNGGGATTSLFGGTLGVGVDF
ncbi:MAG: tetratricopeptide repeat protein [Deltaproteobacteria bacterium]|nr:MAG: tetratricopeptide repeat protein [Deltaproteobacteria bacterium]